MRSIETVVNPLTSKTIKSYREAEKNLRNLHVQPNENSIKEFSKLKDSLSSSRGFLKNIKDKIYNSNVLPRITGDYNGVRFR